MCIRDSVFSIWGLIYVALIVWLVQYTRDAPNRVRRFGFVALLFVVSCALNVAWLALFHFLQVYVGLFVIAALWACLLYTSRCVSETACALALACEARSAARRGNLRHESAPR